MLRYKLRTLLILLKILPPLLAVGWWKYSTWRAERERQKAIEAERVRRRLNELIELTTWQAERAAIDADEVKDVLRPTQPKAPAKAGE